MQGNRRVITEVLLGHLLGHLSCFRQGIIYEVIGFLQRELAQRFPRQSARHRPNRRY